MLRELASPTRRSKRIRVAKAAEEVKWYRIKMRDIKNVRQVQRPHGTRINKWQNDRIEHIVRICWEKYHRKPFHTELTDIRRLVRYEVKLLTDPDGHYKMTQHNANLFPVDDDFKELAVIMEGLLEYA
jgi:hypothetical protein